MTLISNNINLTAYENNSLLLVYIRSKHKIFAHVHEAFNTSDSLYLCIQDIHEDMMNPTIGY